MDHLPSSSPPAVDSHTGENGGEEKTTTTTHGNETTTHYSGSSSTKTNPANKQQVFFYEQIEDYDLRLRKQAWTEVMSKKHLNHTFNALAHNRLKTPKKRTVIWKREIFYRKYSKLAKWVRYEETSPGAWTTLSERERERRSKQMDQMGYEGDSFMRMDYEKQAEGQGYDSRDESSAMREKRRQSDRLRSTKIGLRGEGFEDEEGMDDDVAKVDRLFTSSTGRVVRKIDYAQFM